MYKKLLLTVVVFAFAKALSAQNTVVELFTSQGCSSCPPADQLLADIQEKHGDDVITLSYHVDYWDYIGWKDPFATEDYTQKQYKYARAFSSRQVYTPQAIINGRSHFTGSDQQKMTKALSVAKLADNKPSLKLNKVVKEAENVSVNYRLDAVTSSQTITLALTIKKRVTSVKRGENRNRTLTNHNIVVDLTEVKAAGEGSVTLKIPHWVTDSDDLAVVSYVTEAGVGIVSALSSAI